MTIDASSKSDVLHIVPKVLDNQAKRQYTRSIESDER